MSLLVTECGTTKDGHSVLAVTDDIGPQVIIVSEKVHLLSPILQTHSNAELLGRCAVIAGLSVCEFGEWTDLKKESLPETLFRLATSVLG